MSLNYTKKVLEHFENPRNVGEIKNPDAFGTRGSAACGDILNIYLNINSKTDKITEIKFLSYGCASNIATASIMTEMVEGKTVEEAKKLDWNEITKDLGGLPPQKIHCSVLAKNALLRAIEDWEEKNKVCELCGKKDKGTCTEEDKNKK